MSTLTRFMATLACGLASLECIASATKFPEGWAFLAIPPALGWLWYGWKTATEGRH